MILNGSHLNGISGQDLQLNLEILVNVIIRHILILPVCY